MTVSMGFITGILAHEVLKYNSDISESEALSVVTMTLGSHEGQPDTGSLWLQMIREIDSATEEYRVNRALANEEYSNGRESQSSAQV